MKIYSRGAADASWYILDICICRLKQLKVTFLQINIIDPTSMGSCSRIKLKETTYSTSQDKIECVFLHRFFLLTA